MDEDLDSLLNIYDEITAELAAYSNEDLERYMNELEATVQLEQQVVCPFCIKGEIKTDEKKFFCSDCSFSYLKQDSLQNIEQFGSKLNLALNCHSNHGQNCSGVASFSFVDDDIHPEAFLCCSVNKLGYFFLFNFIFFV